MFDSSLAPSVTSLCALDNAANGFLSIIPEIGRKLLKEVSKVMAHTRLMNTSLPRSLIDKIKKQSRKSVHSVLTGQQLPPAMAIATDGLKSSLCSIKHILCMRNAVRLPGRLAVCVAENHLGEHIRCSLTGAWGCRASDRGVTAQVSVIQRMEGSSVEQNPPPHRTDQIGKYTVMVSWGYYRRWQR